MRNIEWMKNSKIANFWSQTLIFRIKKKTRNFLIFQFGQLQKLQIWKIREIFTLENFKDLQFGKLKKKFLFENFKNCRFVKFQKYPISKIPTI